MQHGYAILKLLFITLGSSLIQEDKEALELQFLGLLMWPYQGLVPARPVKRRQMSIKVAQKMISLQKLNISLPLQKLLKNVGDLGKLIVAKGFEKSPKVP